MQLGYLPYLIKAYSAQCEIENGTVLRRWAQRLDKFCNGLTYTILHK